MTNSTEYMASVDKAYAALMHSETEQALDLCQDAARIEPHSLPHIMVLGLVSMAMQDMGRAIKFMEEGHRRAPNTKEFADALAALHARVGNMSDSMYYAKLVMVLDSDEILAKLMPDEFTDLERNLEYAGVTSYHVDASIAFHERDYQKAIGLCSREIAVHPNNADCHKLQGRAYIEIGEYDLAEAALKEAAALEPNNVDNVIYLAEALTGAGRPDDAEAAYRNGISRSPSSTELRNRLVHSLAYSSEENWRSRTGEIEEISKLLAAGKPQGPTRPTMPMKLDQLIVGFVINESARAHHLKFAESVFRNYDKSRLRIIVYQQYSQPFAGTTGLRQLVDDWRESFDIDDQTLDLVIRNDGVQVLVDLCGLSPGHRQTVMAGRPAPACVGWLGMPHERVPAATDAILLDDNTVLSDGGDGNVVSLGNCMLAYAGGLVDLELSAENASPAAANGFVTFGAFLEPAQLISAAGIWARVLQAVPEARLVLGGTGEVREGTVRLIQETFEPRGVVDRIIAGAAGSVAELYASIDVLLDARYVSNPAGICDALWMGVPVVSLLGDRPSGRIGASLLKAADRAEWVGANEDEYINIAKSLGQSGSEFETLRAGLREDLLRSELCDQAGFARRFEDCLSEIYRPHDVRAT